MHYRTLGYSFTRPDTDLAGFCPSPPPVGFTTAAYLRVHAVKDHGLAAPRLERFLCKLCGVHCKTPAQLNGHLQTHAGEGATATEGQPLR